MLSIVVEPSLGDCRLTVIAPPETSPHRGKATLRGTDEETSNTERRRSTTAEAVFLIFSPPLDRRSCCETLMSLLI
jgi:hypothetical protein